MATELAPRRASQRNSLKRKSDLDLESPTLKKRATPTFEPTTVKQHASATNIGSELLMTPQINDHPSSLTLDTSGGQIVQPNTGNSLSLSQASTTSQSSQISTAMKSSTTSDTSFVDNSPTLERTSTTKQKQTLKLQVPQSSDRSRSSSVDDAPRSSSRSKKPTAKAQALADAGTRFYKSLKPTPDPADNQHDISGSPVAESPVVAELETPVTAVVQEPEEGVLDSVESPSIRTSPRTRKPTAKVIAESINQPMNKRKAPSEESGRPSKIARLSSAIPDKPSKLRYSISSTEEEIGARIEMTESKDLPKAVNDKSPCSLKCLSPSKKLLALAEFAFNEDDDDDDEEDIDALLAAVDSEIQGTGTFQLFNKFVEQKQRCVCEQPPLPAAVDGPNDTTNMTKPIKPTKKVRHQPAKKNKPATRTSVRQAGTRNTGRSGEGDAPVAPEEDSDFISQQIGKISNSALHTPITHSDDRSTNSSTHVVPPASPSADAKPTMTEETTASSRPRSILKLKIVTRKPEETDGKGTNPKKSHEGTLTNDIVKSSVMKTTKIEKISTGGGGRKSDTKKKGSQKPYSIFVNSHSVVAKNLAENMTHPERPQPQRIDQQESAQTTTVSSKEEGEHARIAKSYRGIKGSHVETKRLCQNEAAGKSVKGKIVAGKSTTSSSQVVEEAKPSPPIAAEMSSRERWLNVELPSIMAYARQCAAEAAKREAAEEAAATKANQATK